MERKITQNKTKYELKSLLDSSLHQLLNSQYKNSKKIIIVDENTQQECLPKLLNSFDALKGAEIVVLPQGEENKVLEICVQVWESFLDYSVQRNDLVINLGGGVITDMGGFIASVYMRGLDFINIPTTLLAMVDASIGGKTGVNLGNYKNQLGVFSQPVFTICDTVFLQSLDEREIQSGKAEMLKHGLIASEQLFNKLSKEKQLIPSDQLISEAMQIKANIVSSDYKEQGERKKLNFGHTVGHSMESLLMAKQIKTSHGLCVAWGMLVESYLSMECAGLTKEAFQDIATKIRGEYQELPIAPTDFNQLIALMHQDKKNQGSSINFTLLQAIGRAKIDQQLTEHQVLKGLKAVFSEPL